MTAPDAAELMKLCDEILHAHPTQTIAAPDERHKALARALKSILSAPTEAEIALIEDWYHKSSRLDEAPRVYISTLLRYIKSRALRVNPHASFTEEIG